MTTDKDIIIKVENLHKSFGELKVLRGIDQEIERGEVVVVVGPSGSGKSTFLRALNMLEPPTEGKIIFEGTDLTDKSTDINLHRQKIGMVFQHFNLFKNMSVLRNLMLAPVDLKKESKEEARVHALAMLQRVGLSDKSNAYPQQLSGGQKQRVAIARALITNPQIILADEPTGALDSKTSVEVMQLLKRLNEQEKITIIVVTHESGVANETNKIIHIKDGVIGEIEENKAHQAWGGPMMK